MEQHAMIWDEKCSYGLSEAITNLILDGFTIHQVVITSYKDGAWGTHNASAAIIICRTEV